MLNVITDNLDVWTTAKKQKKAVGRGRAKKEEGYGIKKLRELILELAVRGKLVPQNPNDEPASVLLKRVAEEKQRLIEEGEIKNQKVLIEIREDEKQYNLPDGWEYTRLGSLANRVGSGSTPRGGKNAYTDSGIAFLRSQNIWNHGIEIDNVAFIPVETHLKMSNTTVYPDDILLNITGASLGRCAIYPTDTGEANVSQHVTIIRPTESQTKEYLHLCILSPYTQALIWGRQVGMAREGLSKKVLELFEIPLPPLAEQHRIVAKVDELMALCDQLEQEQADHQATHQTLVKTLLNGLVESATLRQAQGKKNNSKHPEPVEGQAADYFNQLIAEHFDTLFTTEQSIDQLKQTILQLAVMGKLVPQDSNDEPASVLLEKIAKEKAKLIEEGKIKKQKVLPEIAEDEKLFKLPKSWMWVKMEDICYGITSGSTPPKSIFQDEAGIPYLKVYNIQNQKIDFEYRPQFIDDEYHSKKLKRSMLFSGDVVMNIVGPPLGKIAIIPTTYPQWNCNQAIVFFRPIETKLNTYIYTYLISGVFLNSIKLIGTAGQDNISVTKSRKIAVPLPPLAEQHRIVTKVNQLLTLCDTLKANLNQSQTTQTQLADAIVKQAVN